MLRLNTERSMSERQPLNVTVPTTSSSASTRPMHSDWQLARSRMLHARAQLRVGRAAGWSADGRGTLLVPCTSVHLLHVLHQAAKAKPLRLSVCMHRRLATTVYRVAD